ncbi:hypothetical protein ACC756_32415, partial [Rhizobium ruizarguesonis]
RYRTNNSNQKPLERTQDWIKLGGKVNSSPNACHAIAIFSCDFSPLELIIFGCRVGSIGAFRK